MKNMFDLSALDEMPSETKERLLKLIASQSEYFIITGSDPLDLAGCCPSDGVRAANQLVGAGILQVVQSKSTPDSCPVNIYAFSGEIKAGDSKPEFTIDREFRQKIKGYLTSVKSKRKVEKADISSLLAGNPMFFPSSILELTISFPLLSRTANQGIPDFSEASWLPIE